MMVRGSCGGGGGLLLRLLLLVGVTLCDPWVGLCGGLSALLLLVVPPPPAAVVGGKDTLCSPRVLGSESDDDDGCESPGGGGKKRVFNARSCGQRRSTTARKVGVWEAASAGRGDCASDVSDEVTSDNAAVRSSTGDEPGSSMRSGCHDKVSVMRVELVRARNTW